MGDGKMRGAADAALFGLFALALLLVVGAGLPRRRRCRAYAAEGFAQPAQSSAALIPAGALVVVQGHGLPQDAAALRPQPPDLAADPGAGLDVTGERAAPNSLLLFKYNRCAPECCDGRSSGMSCDHGCVCWTDAQRRAFFQAPAPSSGACKG